MYCEDRAPDNNDCCYMDYQIHSADSIPLIISIHDHKLQNFLLLVHCYRQPYVTILGMAYLLVQVQSQSGDVLV